jgi:hypothetical protein
MIVDAVPVVLRKPFVQLVRNVVDPALLAKIREAVASNAAAAHVASMLPQYTAHDPAPVWAVYFARMSNAYAEIMARAAIRSRVRKAVERAPEITVPTNPYAKQWIKRHASDLCVELSRQQHESVRQVVQRMYDEGRRPEEIAEHVRQVVGLTSRQEIAVANYRDNLDDGSHTDDELDALAERYAHKQLVYRSENIGRTENAFAVENGRRTEWLQARDDGEIEPGTKRRWVALHASARLCDRCAYMDGQEVGLDEQFEAEDGELVDCAPLHTCCGCITELSV